MKTKDVYRLLEDGEEVWRGKAFSPEDAEEAAFFHDSPSSLSKYTLQRWGPVKVSSSSSLPGWVTVYKDAQFED